MGVASVDAKEAGVGARGWPPIAGDTSWLGLTGISSEENGLRKEGILSGKTELEAGGEQAYGVVEETG